MDWEVKGSKLILKTGAMHTCRDFGAIQEWAKTFRAKTLQRAAGEDLIVVD